MATTPATKDKSPAKARTTTIEMRPTDLKHVFLIDWNDTGVLMEIAVVMIDPRDGSIFGIPVENLHPIDKSRLKKFLVSVHADKYALWELLSQGKLNNGCNPLDYFHSNYVKVKRPLGAVLGGGLASVEVYNDTKMIGEEFSNPASATLANEVPTAFA